MEDNPHMDGDLLARYVAGEADGDERARVERWAAQAPEHRREVDAMRAAWDLGAEGSPLPRIDVDAAWNAVQRTLGSPPASRVIAFRPGRAAFRWLAAAAVIAGLLFAARLLFSPATQEVLANARHVTARLPDSTTVVVSPGSRVEVHMDGERRVALSGEAYFEVQRDVRRPFRVDAGDVQVTVLGTGFEVTAYDTSDHVLVRVRHGRVRVATANDTVVLEAGQHAHYDRQRHFLERVAAPPMEIWGERIIQFDRASLAQVADQLGRLFQVKVELGSDALSRCELTASFDNEPIDTVLRVISDTFGLRVERPDPRRYILVGDGC